MASKSDNTKRTVIPNWNDFQTTSISGELLGCNNVPSLVLSFPITQYVRAWEEQHSFAFAGDLISAAIMNQQTKLPAVIDAANFIINRAEKCPLTLLETAKYVIQSEMSKSIHLENNISEKIDCIINKDSTTKERVRFLRRLIYRYQYNPIWYVELSRAYATLGLLEKACSAMSIALHLSPESRYVTRSASRLYIHINDYDHAHYIITHNPFIRQDPWLLASEIAINASQGRSSKYIKDGLRIIDSDNFSPFSITELSSAIGTKELESSKKNAKKLLAKSLIQPNDNSLSQADWLMNVDRTIALDFSEMIKPQINYESDSRFSFLQDDYESALSHSIDWIGSAPFAKSAINFAAEMAYTYLHDYENAAKILRIGLISNPNDHAFMNNLAYTYALDNQTDKADKILCQLKHIPSNDSESIICAIATEGLNEYRKGNNEAGRVLYLTAIEEAKKLGNIRLAHKAILNSIREEVRFNPQQNKQDVIATIEKLNTGNTKETEVMRQDILSYIK